MALSVDESVMGFAFPKEERAALVASEPQRFQMPSASDMRYNWVHADLAALDPTEARELVVDAWRMVVPKKLSRAYDLSSAELLGQRNDDALGAADVAEPIRVLVPRRLADEFEATSAQAANDVVDVVDGEHDAT